MFYGQCNDCGERWELGTASTCTCPQPDRWVGLTDEEIEHCCHEADSKAKDHPKTWKWTEAFARAIEAKLRERNT